MKKIEISDLRAEVVRRALAVSEPRRAALNVAALALLHAAGRRDVRDSEIAAEAEALAAALRGNVGFTGAEVEAAVGPWAELKLALEERLAGPAFAMYFRDLEPAGLVAGRLWLRAPRVTAVWMRRRWGRALDELAGREVRFIGED